MINSLNQVLKPLEWHIEKTAKQHDYHALFLLRSIPGVGQIPALVMSYEIHDIKRFPRVQDFSSYARLIRPKKESAGTIGSFVKVSYFKADTVFYYFSLSDL